MSNVPYLPSKAIAYAERWALGRNPNYLDFEKLGGDCTNFVSQCLLAGCGVMNETPLWGWYYHDAAHRAPAWTGVTYLHRFLTENRGSGPYGALVSLAQVQPGDVAQLSFSSGRYTHTALVVARKGEEIYLAAHTHDAWMRPLSTYQQPFRRFVHIQGARKET